MAFLPARDMVDDFKLPATAVYGNSPAIKFDNGSVIYFIGADSEKAIGRLRGTPNLVLCIIDESGVYADDMLASMIKAVGPGLRPRGGKIVIMGTPPEGRSSGTAIDISNNPVYEQHRFDYLDNDRVPSFADVEKLIDEDLAAQLPGLTREERRRSSYFLREYKGLVAVDDAELVYSFSEANIGEPDDDVYLSGMSSVVAGHVGVMELDAAVLLQWLDDDDMLYVTDEIVGNEAAVMDRVALWDSSRNPSAIEIYAGEKPGSIKALRARYGDLPIVEPVPAAVNQQIADLNAALRSGRLMTFRGSRFERDVKLPTWVDKIVNGKVDDAGSKKSFVVPAVRYGVLAARPLLPERRRLTRAERARQLAEAQRRARIADEQRKFSKVSAATLREREMESYGDDRYDSGDDGDEMN
jgi:hypothetical protein